MARCAAHRLVTTIAVVVSLLFAQLALAGYVCPVPVDAPPAMDMDMASGAPCHGTDTQPQAPALCHHHCTNAAQSFEPVKIPTVSLPAIVQALLVPLRVESSRGEAVAFATKGEAQPPPAPVFLSTLRLRV